MLDVSMTNREFNCGFIIPFINYYIVVDNEGVSIWPCSVERRGNKLLWLITSVLSWLFHVTGDETYSDVEDTFVLNWYLCVLGFYIHINEYYTFVDTSECEY